MALSRRTRSSHVQVVKAVRLSRTRETTRLAESLTSAASSTVLNSGMEVLGGAVSIYVSEQRRWFDGVGPSAKSSKVAHNGDW